ncbi:MAG: hypothetical protein ACI85O_003945 [Saprospiraceae bacterium]|jgi:hypothetical protein
MHNSLLLLFFLLSSLCLLGQDEIFFYNPSFEDIPRLGQVPIGWHDCNTEGNTPVDTHPVPYGSFQVTTPPAHGNTYVGMVVRKNNAVEAIGQKLVEPLKKGRLYVFEIFLARSPKYISASFSNLEGVNFNTPCKLRILGGDDFCDRKELLAESKLIIKEQWVNQQFIFRPKEDYSYLVFEAFYENAIIPAYNGNLLLDGATTITEVKEDGSFFADSLYQRYFPPADLYTNVSLTGNVYEDYDTSSPTAGVIRNFADADKQFYSEQMPYVIFKRGMTALEGDAIAALSAIGKRILASKTEENLMIRFKEGNNLLYKLRLNTIRDVLLEAGLPDTRFSFGEKPEDEIMFSSGSRDVEMMIY